VASTSARTTSSGIHWPPQGATTLTTNGGRCARPFPGAPPIRSAAFEIPALRVGVTGETRRSSALDRHAGEEELHVESTTLLQRHGRCSSALVDAAQLGGIFDEARQRFPLRNLHPGETVAWPVSGRRSGGGPRFKLRLLMTEGGRIHAMVSAPKIAKSEILIRPILLFFMSVRFSRPADALVGEFECLRYAVK